ncbi:hypothetical protein FGB62_60g01 [Gracilaria domingensis]|nr:hypothetical protein FGB62_60g01 [Gracilaria domingensis]
MDMRETNGENRTENSFIPFDNYLYRIEYMLAAAACAAKRESGAAFLTEEVEQSFRPAKGIRLKRISLKPRQQLNRAFNKSLGTLINNTKFGINNIQILNCQESLQTAKGYRLLSQRAKSDISPNTTAR